MKIINRLAGLVAALTITVVSVPAGAAAIDDIVFFGDSLSDTGNVWYATGRVSPVSVLSGQQWPAARFHWWPVVRSGRTILADALCVHVWPDGDALARPGGNNYAWGGARTGVNPDPSGVPWLDQQVMLYQLSGSQPDARTLVSIMIGGNDVANNLGDAAALEAGITSIITQMANLYGLGVRQFVVSNVPDVGATPEFQARDVGSPGIAEFATFWTMQWNAALESALDQLQLPGAVISYFDLFSFSKDPELLAMFANTTDACLTARLDLQRSGLVLLLGFVPSVIHEPRAGGRGAKSDGARRALAATTCRQLPVSAPARAWPTR